MILFRLSYTTFLFDLFLEARAEILKAKWIQDRYKFSSIFPKQYDSLFDYSRFL